MKVPSSHLSYCIIKKNWTYNSYISDKQKCWSVLVWCRQLQNGFVGDRLRNTRNKKQKKAQISIKFYLQVKMWELFILVTYEFDFPARGRTFGEIPKLSVDSRYVYVFPGNAALPACYVALCYLVDSFSCSVLILVWREDMVVVVPVVTTLATPARQENEKLKDKSVG